MLTCKICGLKATNLITHIVRTHKMSCDEYKKKYNVKKVQEISKQSIDKIKKSLKLYWTEERKEEFKKKSHKYSQWNKQFWIERYNMTEEEAIKKISEVQRKNAKKAVEKFKPSQTQWNKQFWIERYNMTEEEAIKKISEVQAKNSIKSKKFKGKNHTNKSKQKISNGMKKVIKDYGLTKWAAHFNTENPYSIPEKQIYDYILDNINENAEHNKTIRFDENKIYNVDIIYDNQIIELFGDFWHMNPNKYNENDINPVTKLYAKDIWKKDNQRINDLKSLGYNVKIIWEHDWYNKKEKVFND